MSKKEAYEKKMQSQFDVWSADIDRLKAKADMAEADAQLKYYKQIEDLRDLQNVAKERISELREAHEDAWEDLRAGVNSAWDSLGKAMKSGTKRFD